MLVVPPRGNIYIYIEMIELSKIVIRSIRSIICFESPYLDPESF